MAPENNTIRNTLDIGCGTRKKANAVGIDINPRSAADVIHNLEVVPYPFADNSFDEIYADNVLEHLSGTIAIMEEIHRLGRHGALVVISVPYFRSKWAYADPTHKVFFSAESFAYFIQGTNQHDIYRYSTAEFSLQALRFNEGLKAKGLMGLIQAPANFIANRWPLRYENYLSHLIPLDQLTFYLRVVK
ncbi:MAG: class I SAM-dependent methyltransferase [Elusimicrobiaceae bacterium]|jgi:SAM-dependent methyltransferase